MSRQTDAAGLAAEFRRIQGQFARTADAGAATQQLVELACATLSGCEWAAITRWPPHGRADTLAASAAVPRQIDQIQSDIREGPGLSVAADQEIAWLPDLRSETRWPRFVPRALSTTPVRGAICYHVSWTPVRSALGLYAADPDTMDWTAVNAGTEFATHAATVMAHPAAAAQATALEQVLHSSRQVGIAVGMLMKAHGMTAEAALRRLQDDSDRTGQSLEDAARAVIRTHRLSRWVRGSSG